MAEPPDKRSAGGQGSSDQTNAPYGADGSESDPGPSAGQYHEDLRRINADQGTSSASHVAGVLSGQEIRDAQLIAAETYVGECLKAASYDLRLGPEYIRCGDNIDRVVDLDDDDASVGLTIEPFETVVFSTRETVAVPRNVVGRFGLRIGWALRGLVIQVGPQVEPGYRGPLFGAILNVSGDAVQIPLDEPFLTIEFAYVSCPPEDSVYNPEKISSLREFVRRKRIQLAHLAKPNLVQQHHARLEPFVSRQEAERDRETAKQAVRWTKKGVTVALCGLLVMVLALVVAVVTLVLSDDVRSWFQHVLLQQAPEHEDTSGRLQKPRGGRMGQSGKQMNETGSRQSEDDNE